MAGTGKVITDHSACSCVTDFIEVEQPVAMCSKHLARCMIIAFHFNENAYIAIMLLLQPHILQITFLSY